MAEHGDEVDERVERVFDESTVDHRGPVSSPPAPLAYASEVNRRSERLGDRTRYRFTQLFQPCRVAGTEPSTAVTSWVTRSMWDGGLEEQRMSLGNGLRLSRGGRRVIADECGADDGFVVFDLRAAP